MTLKFCEKCKTLMSPHKANNKIILKCSNCGFSEKAGTDSIRVIDKIKKEKTKGRGIMNENNIFANYGHKCEKCGYNKVQILDLGIFVSDEDNLIILKCGRCGWCERIGKRTG